MLRRHFEPESDPADGFDPPGIAEFAADPRHVGVDRLGRAIPVGVPDVLDDVGARPDRTGIVGEERQQLEFLRRERDLGDRPLEVEGDAVGAAIDA